MQKNYRILFFFLSVLLIPSYSHSDRGITLQNNRFALVIGNADYKSGPLKNPVNDASDMTRILKDLGFDVIHRENVNQREMELSIREFGTKLKDGSVGLFYYAGHGLQVNGRNYLIPVGAEIIKEFDIKYESIDAGRILDEMHQAGNEMNIVILDACRDNPFARSFRSSSRGLAQMDAPRGSIIAYSTAPGSIASDGDGRNSIYTKHLAKYIDTPNLTIEKIFKSVRINVVNETQGQQVPWESSSLMGDFYFKKSDNLPGQLPELIKIPLQASNDFRNRKKIIFLPFLHISDGYLIKNACNEKIIRGIIANFKNSDEFKITNSFCDLTDEDTQEKIETSPLFSLTEKFKYDFEFWKKGGIFSSWKPDSSEMKRLGKKFNADYAVTYFSEAYASDSDYITIYVMDIAKEKIIKKTGMTRTWTSQGASEAYYITNNVFSDLKK